MEKEKLLLISGPNLNLLGMREPDIYGDKSLNDAVALAEKAALQFDYELEHFQSNSEREIIEVIQQAKKKFRGIIINAGALSHYSYSIGDALSYFGKPVVELHITNVLNRETFRHVSALSVGVSGFIAGFGVGGYELAVIGIIKLINEEKK